MPRYELVAEKIDEGRAVAQGTGPRLSWTPALATAAAEGHATLEAPPLPPLDLQALHRKLLKLLVPHVKSAIQSGLQAGPHHESTTAVLWRWFDTGPYPGADLALETAAFRLVGTGSGIPAPELLATLAASWVARGGWPFALAVLAESAGPVEVRYGLRTGANGTATAAISMIDRARTAASLFRERIDAYLRAGLAAATDTERAAARAAATELRATGSPITRALMSAVLLDPAWIDADLRARAASTEGLVLDVHLLHAPDPDVLVDVFARMSTEELQSLTRVTGHHDQAPGWIAAFLDRHRESGIPAVSAFLRRVTENLPESEWSTGQYWLMGAVPAALGALSSVEGSVAVCEAAAHVLSTLADQKFPKAADPRPLALDLLRRSPVVALPIVTAAAKQKNGAWARTLAPQLERMTGAVQVAEEADPADVPSVLARTWKKKAPPFWSPVAFTRPLLRNGRSLPAASLEGLGAILEAGDSAAVDALKTACRPDTLAAFGWDLFQAWLGAGSPSKEKWAFTGLGLVGDDETARRLVPLIRVWPGEAAHARAVTGLEILATIGSDTALMGLHGIAQKLKFKGLQEKAREKMDEIAAKRGFTAEELADRLVPDLDLEDDGSKVLDFGPRSFRVGFDEALAPFVTDATGKRLTDLPKPNSKDDAALAGEAVTTWKAMKKDARSLAALQIARFELAMGTQRRWTPTDFDAFLVRHPLLVHVVRRLVWGTRDATGTLLDPFRVAEDRTLADVEDAPFALDPNVTVGIVHRLELPDALADRWIRLFADYAIAQPFDQLTRDTYRITDVERALPGITRFSGHEVETRKMLGLQSRGWRRGAPQDAGVFHWFEKPITRDLSAWLMFANGIGMGSPEWNDPTQELGEIRFASHEPYYRQTSACSHNDIPAVVLSEILRDVRSLEGV